MGADSRYPFLTRKERDVETGLDYFNARYYGATSGRFTSPDPLNASARPKNPQSWNRYSYVLNRPMVLIDPNGMHDCTPRTPCILTTEADAEAITRANPSLALVQESVTIADPSIQPLTTTSADPEAVSLLPKPPQEGLSGETPGNQQSGDEIYDPPSSSGYTDVNLTYGTHFFIGITVGIMFESGREYPYIGLGIMLPGPGASVMYSPDTVSGGVNAELQLNVGVAASVGVDQQGNSFTSQGGGWPPGMSFTEYYVFGAKHPTPSVPQRPRGNQKTNPNCACNR